MKLFLFKKSRGMAMIIVMTAAFVVLVTIGFTVAFVSGGLERGLKGGNKDRALANAQVGLERARGLWTVNGNVFDSCQAGDCLDTTNGTCGSCTTTFYQNGDDKYKIRIDNLTMPSGGGVAEPIVGSATFTSYGSYKNIEVYRSGSLCLDYCTVANFNCGDNGCNGSCGTCPVGQDCVSGTCSGVVTSCNDAAVECDNNCVNGDICGGGTVIDQDLNIVAIGGGCQGEDGTGCGEGVDSLSKRWDSTEVEDTGATDADNGETNATTLRTLGGNPDIDPQYEAVKFCDDLTFNGFTDWYLPASREFNTLDTACLNGWASNFDSAQCYWFSTEINTTNATQEPIACGVIPFFSCDDNKQEASLLRCLRRY